MIKTPRSFRTIFRKNRPDGEHHPWYFCTFKKNRQNVPAHPHRNILIIDDNPEFIRSFGRLLEDVAGDDRISIRWTHNIYDGMALLRDNYFEYVFLNVKMSDIDNICIAQSVKKGLMYAPKIIALSFHTEAIFRAQVMRAGATQYLMKDDIDHQTICQLLA